jgi:hypothetical protein
VIKPKTGTNIIAKRPKDCIGIILLTRQAKKTIVVHKVVKNII